MKRLAVPLPQLGNLTRLRVGEFDVAAGGEEVSNAGRSKTVHGKADQASRRFNWASACYAATTHSRASVLATSSIALIWSHT